MLKHYYLAATTVQFLLGDNASSIPVNCVGRFTQKNVRRYELDQLNQLAAQVFMNQIPEEDRKDVRILGIIHGSISYLGEMTEEEFMYRPEAKLQMVDTNTVLPS